MKNFAQHILFFLLILLLSCNKDNIKETSNVLSPGFAFQEINGKGIFINESSKNAIYYELTIGNDTLIKGQMIDTLGVYHFKFNGKYEVKLLVENLEGYEITMTKTIQINNIKQDTTINSTNDSTLLKPEINISYTLLDSGIVQIKNTSKNTVVYNWTADWMQSKEINPKFRFLENGKHWFALRFYSEYNVEKDTIFDISINNVSQANEIATIEGTIFNKSYKYSGRAIPRNSFFGYGEPTFPRGTPTSGFAIPNQGQQVYIADFEPIQGNTIETMRNNFKVGKKQLAQLTSYPTSDYSLNKNGWYFLFTGQDGVYTTGNNQSDSLEILEVREVHQAKLFPEMEETAFWVTWRIIANTGERGKIDCVLKMKYIIYKQYFDF